MEYKMKLSSEQKDILEGKHGEIKSLMIKTLIMFGEDGTVTYYNRGKEYAI
ncbi:MAG: hypothetical protein QM214_02120 [Bacillota bacterium]|jgi:hypothetical protein|nr:hypothetical protein [Bacillota bacterium]HHU42787.1 hypothetical protein [Clostridiales bacterium]